MASVNKVILIGNLGADPEKKFTGNGQPVTTFRIATTEAWKDKQGQKQERTEWHRVVVYGPQAESCAQYLSKGRPVFVEGSIRNRQWEDQQKQTRYITEIIAQRVQFLGSNPNAGGGERSYGGGGSSGRGSSATGMAQNDSFPEVPDMGPSGGDDDIPF